MVTRQHISLKRFDVNPRISCPRSHLSSLVTLDQNTSRQQGDFIIIYPGVKWHGHLLDQRFGLLLCNSHDNRLEKKKKEKNHKSLGVLDLVDHKDLTLKRLIETITYNSISYSTNIETIKEEVYLTWKLASTTPH